MDLELSMQCFYAGWRGGARFAPAELAATFELPAGTRSFHTMEVHCYTVLSAYGMLDDQGPFIDFISRLFHSLPSAYHVAPRTRY